MVLLCTLYAGFAQFDTWHTRTRVNNLMVSTSPPSPHQKKKAKVPSGAGLSDAGAFFDIAFSFYLQLATKINAM